MLRETKLPTCNLLVQIFVIRAPKGELSTKHCIEEDACCPDIRRWPNILLLHYYFRTHIAGCATEYFQFYFGRSTATEAKIDQLYTHFLCVNYDIFKLYVPMRYISLM